MRQIHFTIGTNIGEFEVSVSWTGQFRPLTSPILPVTLRNTIFRMDKHICKFGNSDKYIYQLAQIQGSLRCQWVWPGNFDPWHPKHSLLLLKIQIFLVTVKNTIFIWDTNILQLTKILWTLDINNTSCYSSFYTSKIGNFDLCSHPLGIAITLQFSHVIVSRSYSISDFQALYFKI